jgi:hypothetical protein
VNSSLYILFEYVPIIYPLKGTILIGSQIIFINFSILNTVSRPIRIVHLSCVPLRIQIRYVTTSVGHGTQPQSAVLHSAYII